jgi:DNA-binding NarL/FixJ family response regulator
MPIRVVLVDDHQIVREGIRVLLANNANIQIVGEAASGTDAVKLARELNPDVMTLDVTMPGLNGIETMHEIRRHAPETEVLGLSMHAADQVVTDMLRAGASGYLLKSASVQQLAQAIETVMRGHTYISPEIADLVPPELLRIDSSDPSVSRELSAREREVLKLVAEGRSSREIADALYVTTKTVVWHRQSIMQKLNLRSVAELTKYAVRMGLTSL